MSKQETIGYPILCLKIIPNQQSMKKPGQYQMNNVEEPFDFTCETNPVPITCPHCKKQGVTMVKSKIGSTQWRIWIAWCLFGCWCCCCLPCYFNELREASHSCQHCGSYLGSGSKN